MDGYGSLFEIRNGHMTSYETTAVSCLRAGSAERNPSLSDGNQVVFNGDLGSLRITGGPTEDEKIMHRNHSVSHMRLLRTSEWPKPCKQELVNTAPNNYAVFWQTFAEQFALFPTYHTDWAVVDRKYRVRVTSTTTPEELFQTLSEMVDPFHNGHIDIRARSIGREYFGYKPSADILQSKNAEKISRIIESKYIQGGMQGYCNAQIQYGKLMDSIGFLRIVSFENYTDEAFGTALDEIFGRAGQLKGLIIDVRINEGGADLFGIEIASRLTANQYLAYFKNARNNSVGSLHFTQPEAVWVPVSSRPGFKGRVVLLAGADTLSAGETFAMALMNRTPRVTRIGDDTQGLFSDKLRRSLPNGWVFALPNEIYVTKEGRAFDAIGLPPDIRVPVFAPEDLAHGRDNAIEKAMQILSVPQT